MEGGGERTTFSLSSLFFPLIYRNTHMDMINESGWDGKACVGIFDMLLIRIIFTLCTSR